MNIKLSVKDGNKKLKALEEVEKHIKEAKRLLMWALDGSLEIEGEVLPEDTDSTENQSLNS